MAEVVQRVRLDAKNRLQFNAYFRDKIAERGEQPYLVKLLVPALEVWYEGEMRLFQEQLSKELSFETSAGFAHLADVKAQLFFSHFLLNRVELNLEGSGRAVIPDHLKRLAGIDVSVAVFEYGHRIRIIADPLADSVAASVGAQFEAEMRNSDLIFADPRNFFARIIRPKPSDEPEK
jgi:DNA-binding transcriptional regulator/RsmH inhibitor MraZ